MTNQTSSLAILRNANFCKANLSDADLSDADLSNAILRKTDLRKTDFTHADLHKANFTNADLGCDSYAIRCTDFRGAKNLTPEQVKSARNWEQAIYDPAFC